MSVANQRVMFVAAHPDDPEFLARRHHRGDGEGRL